MDLGSLDGLERLIGAIGAALAAALAPIGVIYTASINRRNKLADLTIAGLNEELSRVQKRADHFEQAAERERREGLNWYQLVIFWFNLAHEMRRQAMDARQIAESAARLAGHTLPPWQHSLRLPQINDPAQMGSSTTDDGRSSP